MATVSFVRRIWEVVVNIWDEASMSSSRILEIVNTLHHNIAGNGNLYPFGGKQLVLVREFLQLRPVPSRFDDGAFMFNSFVFSAAVLHRIQLTRLMRQSPDEVDFAIQLQQITLQAFQGNLTPVSITRQRTYFLEKPQPFSTTERL